MAVWLFLLSCCVSAVLAGPSDVIVLNSTTCDDGMGTAWTLWSSWSRINACSASCVGETGTFNRRRSRMCPVQISQCDADELQVQTYRCEGTNGPVNGRYSQWSEWTNHSPCPVFCGARGRVLQVRSRECNDPEPSCGGRYCSGPFRRARRRTCSTSTCGSLCPASQQTRQVLLSPTVEGYFLVCRRGIVFVIRCPRSSNALRRIFRLFSPPNVLRIRQLCGI